MPALLLYENSGRRRGSFEDLTSGSQQFSCMPAQAIRWLHLSDFHVGKDDYAVRKMFDYIVEHVGQRKTDGFVPDFVFITGDLANKGLQLEYDDFWLDFVEPLITVIGGNIVERLFVIPGNHDVFRDEHPAFSREEMSLSKSRYFDPTPEGKKLREMLLPRFRAFMASDQTLVRGSWEADEGTFGKIMNVRGSNVGVAGVNTAWLSKDDLDERKLTPGKGLLEFALNKVAAAEIRIVLGHHPLEWLLRDQQKAVKSLLGKSSVIYLHGHLHEAWAEPSNGGGYEFLAIQAGAAFQAREGEKWRNGLVWGFAELSAKEVHLQPWRWTPDQQGWTIAADAFPERFRRDLWWVYPLPGSGAVKSLRSRDTDAVAPPKGWSVVRPEELHGHLQPLEEAAAVKFFNGAVPGWHTALSTSIPRRKIVEQLVNRFRDLENAERPIVALLLAAGCEGKTTAMLQIAYEVIKKDTDWRILRRLDDAESLNTAEILRVMTPQHRWLVIIDEADRIAETLLAFLRQIPRDLEGRVHFVLACRDSDWRSSRANELNWSTLSNFHPEDLAGLNEGDAQAIVTAWTKFGREGLGDLADVPEKKRVDLLVEKARAEAKTKEGAFFGALLSLRHGSDLPKHARLMLERLAQKPIASGGTLRDALGYIAAMHSEGLEFLSRPVLAEVLSCPNNRLHRDVLVPLGQEAAATTTSSFIFTRHRQVAEALVAVLEKEFGVNIADLFVELGMAAVNSFTKEIHVPELAAWRFDLAEHFLNTKRPDMAADIARAVLSCEPENFLTLVNVAKVYRIAKAPEQALQLFHTFPASVGVDPGFYYEWANAEGACGDFIASTLLAAFSLSDDCANTRVGNDRAKLSLAGLGLTFGELFADSREVAFRTAQMATATLGLTLRLDPKAKEFFQKHFAEAQQNGATVPSIEEALTQFREGVAAAEALGVNDRVALLIPDAAHLDFGNLARLIYASSAAGKH